MRELLLDERRMGDGVMRGEGDGEMMSEMSVQRGNSRPLYICLL